MEEATHREREKITMYLQLANLVNLPADNAPAIGNRTDFGESKATTALFDLQV